MTGRYRIPVLPSLASGIPRVWESEKGGRRWHFVR